MAKWLVTIDDHPYVKDGDYTFGSITKLETFIGDNDIQSDHVTELIRDSRIEETKTSYTISEIVPAGGIRLILEVNRKALPHDKYYDNCPAKVVNG
jgi:hypothetical protein